MVLRNVLQTNGIIQKFILNIFKIIFHDTQKKLRCSYGFQRQKNYCKFSIRIHRISSTLFENIPFLISGIVILRLKSPKRKKT